MKRSMIGCAVLAVSLFALSAGAQEQGKAPPKGGRPDAGQAAQAGQAGQGQMDMTQMGPWTRKVKNERQLRNELTAFFKEEDELMKKGDFEGSLARIDFPVMMVTDNAQGTVEAKQYGRDEYAAMMKPFYENMPKDMKVTHKPTYAFLSDSLVQVTDDFTMRMGGKKLSGKSSSLLVKRDGKWLWKVMAEAGWGEPSGGAQGAPAQQKPKK